MFLALFIDNMYVVFLDFYMLYIFISVKLFYYLFFKNLLCNSAFEQGHLIIIIICCVYVLLQDAMKEIKKAEVEEKYLYIENALEEPTNMDDVEKIRVPPPPILLSRTDTKIVFHPAPFNPTSGIKVML